MTAVPITRGLPAVLRKQLGGGGGLGLIIATGGSAVAGATGNAYVNVVIEGVEIRVPRLKGTAAPPTGGVAYILASSDFLLYLGTVSTT